MSFLRKLNNPMTIGIICLVVVAIAVIIYFAYFHKSKTENMKMPEHQAPPTQPQNVETRVEPDKPALVLFWASWCGHSQNMKPEWDKAAQILNSSGMIDAIDFEHKRDATEIAKFQAKYPDLKGFPDIRFFPHGYDPSKPCVRYEGNRTEEAFLKFAYTGGK
jgi:thiol-disulfide isomerase/thioredoxin